LNPARFLNRNAGHLKTVPPPPYGSTCPANDPREELPNSPPCKKKNGNGQPAKSDPHPKTPYQQFLQHRHTLLTTPYNTQYQQYTPTIYDTIYRIRQPPPFCVTYDTGVHKSHIPNQSITAHHHPLYLPSIFTFTARVLLQSIPSIH